MNLWRQQAFGLLCGGLEDCVGGIPLLLIFLILQGFLNEPSIFFKARNWTGMCRNSSLLWVSHSVFLFHQHLFHKDRWRMCFWFEVIRKLILLRETQWERQRLRQRETWNPVTARSLKLTAGFLLLVCMLRDVDIFHLRFCTLPLDVGLAFLKESPSLWEMMWIVLEKHRTGTRKVLGRAGPARPSRF